MLRNDLGTPSSKEDYESQDNVDELVQAAHFAILQEETVPQLNEIDREYIAQALDDVISFSLGTENKPGHKVPNPLLKQVCEVFRGRETQAIPLDELVELFSYHEAAKSQDNMTYAYIHTLNRRLAKLGYDIELKREVSYRFQRKQTK